MMPQWTLRQADIIRASLTHADWTFLKDTTVPYWDQKILQYYTSSGGYSMPAESKQMWNYLTAVRIQGPGSLNVQQR